MKLAGHIAQKPVIVLIDSRAIHNFISTEIVSAVGTGRKVRTEGIYARVVLDLGALRVVTDFLPLKLGVLMLYWVLSGWKHLEICRLIGELW